MEYYASFDWNNYCITVTGPVAISSLPDITGNAAEIIDNSLLFPLKLKNAFVVPLETGNHEVVLNEKFFKECVESYSVPTKVVEANRNDFPVKYFNILDPLKHSNNLGRSVTQGTPLTRDFYATRPKRSS